MKRIQLRHQKILLFGLLSPASLHFNKLRSRIHFGARIPDSDHQLFCLRKNDAGAQRTILGKFVHTSKISLRISVYM
jgi:hypothetical protein